MSDQSRTLPFMTIRGLVVFPRTEVMLVVGRETSVHAIEAALATESREIALVAQRASEKNDGVRAEDMHGVGTVAVLDKVVKLDEARKIFVKATGRIAVRGVRPATAALAQQLSGYLLLPAAGGGKLKVGDREAFLAKLIAWTAAYGSDIPATDWARIAKSKTAATLFELAQKFLATFDLERAEKGTSVSRAERYAAVARGGLGAHYQKHFETRNERINQMVAARQTLLEADDGARGLTLAAALMDYELAALAAV